MQTSARSLNTDVAQQMQPQGTDRYALNTSLGSKQGNLQSRTVEMGNRSIVDLGNTLCGSIPMGNNESLLFVTPGQIYLFNGTTLTLLVDVPDLRFNRANPITGKFNVINGCERMVYWCDGFNPDRYYNLDKPQFFTSINDFRLNPLTDNPQIDVQLITGVGSLRYGAYSVVAEIVDERGSLIRRTVPSEEIYVGDALNIDTFPASTGGQPPFNGSLRIRVTNLPDDQPFVRIAVIGYNTSDGVTPRAFYLPDLIPINNGEATALCTGFDASAGYIPVDFGQLVATQVVYETSHAMETVHGRLLRGNLIETSADYAAFQQAASKIKTEYLVERRPLSQLLDVRTEQGDEIRAYGVCFIMNNGTVTPPFHIPGRPILPSDLDVVSNDDLGLQGVPRWQLENTAGSPTDDVGEFGYYQVEQTYTNPVNYTGTNFWGVDYTGASLQDTNIRYHRIPCRNTVPLLTGFGTDLRAQQIGVRFSNVTYPSADIVGHFFVCDNLVQAEKTVAASGYSIPYNWQPDATGDKREGRYIHYLPNPNDNERQTNTRFQNVITLPYLTTNRVQTVNHLKANGRLLTTHVQNRPQLERFFENNDDLQLYGKHHQTFRYDLVNEYRRVVENRSLLRQTSFDDIQNRSLSSNFNVLELADPFDSFQSLSSNMLYVYMKRTTTLFQNVYSIRYRQFGSTYTTSQGTFEVYDGASFLNRVDITNISDINGSDGLHNIFSRDDVFVEYELLRNLIFEDERNFSRRHEGTDNCSKFWSPGDDITNFIVERIAQRVDEGTTRAWVLTGAPCPEFYGYNKDYQVRGVLKTFRPLNQLFDYSSNCLNKYPNRITYSQVQSEEGLADTWRVYQPLDYVDVPANRGPICVMNIQERSLLVRTHFTCFILQPNQQTIQTSETTIYLGDGSFLAIPAVELDNSPFGYGGQQSRLAHVQTPHGLVWADSNSGKIFQFQGKLSEISRNGMYHFFERELTSDPNERVWNLLGTILAYDPILERVIVHHPKFVPIGTLEQHPDLRYYIDPVTQDRASFTDVDKFENNGFTMSYDIRSNTWTSFHSYQPAFAFYDSHRMYTTMQRDLFTQGAVSDIFAHDDEINCARFYNRQYDAIFQITFNDPMTFQHGAVHYYARAEAWDPVRKQWVAQRGVTFNRAIGFTDQQSSGDVSLRIVQDPYSQAGWSTTVKNVVEADQNYRIGSLRDLSVGEPVMSSEWTLRQSNYVLGQGYIDAVPINIDVNLPQHEQIYFRDKYLNLRLVFTPVQNRITLHYYELSNFHTLR